jgi:hypothetical protein
MEAAEGSVTPPILSDDTVVDMLEIRALLARYCSCVDAREPRAIAESAFTLDGIDDHGIFGSVFRGRDAIEAMFTRSNAITEASAHFVASAVIEVDGDVATGRSYVSGWTWTWASESAGRRRGAEWVFVGIYADRFARTDEGWLISERRVEPLGPGATGFGRRPPAYAGSAGIGPEDDDR